MPRDHTTATIYRGDDVMDVSVPVGTTVSGVLTQLGPGSETLELCDELGRPVGQVETFGASLPAGVVLYTRPKTEREAAIAEREAKAAAAESRSRLEAPLAGAAILTLLSPLISVAYAAHVPYPPRVALGLILIAFSVLLIARKVSTTSVWAALLTPLPAAAGVATLVPHPELVGWWSYCLVLFWAGSVAAFASRAVTRHEYVDAAVRLWLVPAIAVSVISIAQLPASLAAPLGLAFAVILLSVSNSATLQVPEEQLLDLPAVLQTAPSAHAPDAPPPAKITQRRVRHTLHHGSSLRTIAITIACLTALASAPGVAARLGETSIEGWANLGLFAVALLVFTLQPRTARVPYARTAPRLVVVLLLAAAVFLRPDEFGWLWVLVAIALALVAVGSGIWLARGMYAPAITRMADVLELLAVALAIPVGIVAAGGFTFVRAWW